MVFSEEVSSLANIWRSGVEQNPVNLVVLLAAAVSFLAFIEALAVSAAVFLAATSAVLADEAAVLNLDRDVLV